MLKHRDKLLFLIYEEIILFEILREIPLEILLL